MGQAKIQGIKLQLSICGGITKHGRKRPLETTLLCVAKISNQKE
jgi:hypothetical protein